MKFPYAVLIKDADIWTKWMADNIGEQDQEWRITAEPFKETDENGFVWAYGKKAYITIDNDDKSFLYSLRWANTSW